MHFGTCTTRFWLSGPGLPVVVEPEGTEPTPGARIDWADTGAERLVAGTTSTAGAPKLHVDPDEQPGPL
jgi:hypothetical protein